MGSFLIWNKATKDIVHCIPHPVGSTITLDGIFKNSGQNYLDIYEGRDIELTLTTYEFNKTYILDANSNIVTKESLKNNETKLNEAKVEKLAELATARYNTEVSGISLPDGGIIRTDRESQSQLASAVISLANDFITEVDWKGEDGWIKLSKVEIFSIAAMVSQHVQAAFSKEKILTDAVKIAITIEEINGITWI